MLNRWKRTATAGKIDQQLPHERLTNKVYAVDFDGTLCRNQWPKIGTPRWAIILWVRQLQRKGHRWILWTCREGDALKDALAFCEVYGLRPNSINENIPERINHYGCDCRKIGADFYLDDRAQWWVRLLP